MNWFVNEAQGITRANALFMHGAGAPMDTDWMNQVAESLALHGIRTFRTEFRYMARRREDGKKRPPPKAETLLPELADFVEQLRRDVYNDSERESYPLWLIGKSMGGRLATLYAAMPDIDAPPNQVIVLGYPFHPLGKPDRLRTEHLERMRCPCRIIQGTRDPMGKQETVDRLLLPSTVELTWVEKAGHDLRDLPTVTQNLASELLK